MIKNTYTKREVVQLLISNNNMIMRLLGDNKVFSIDGEEVICTRVSRFLPNRELSRHSFDFIIAEAAEG